jgi:transcriptional regulator with XRE-family HTH domain
MDESDARLACVLGRRMRRIRRDQDLSQEAVAWIAGIHRTQISLYENGERMPLLASFVRLAGGLGVSPCVLLDGVTWEGGQSAPGRFAFDERMGARLTATSEGGGPLWPAIDPRP